MPKYLSRRTMLRGMVGGSTVAVGLPLLDAMLNTTQSALADGSDLPCRFLSYYWADGIVIDQWEPSTVGANWAQNLPTALAPLANVAEYCSIISGMRNHCENTITHHEGMTGFNGYTYIPKGGLNTDAGGPTIDQLIADALMGMTPTRAIHVQNSKRVSTDGDGGTTVIAMSHRGSPGNLTAQLPETNPIQVWQTLFGEFVPKPDDRDLRISILDHVREDAKALKTRLGTKDQQRIDAHLQGISELEDKILALPPSCTIPDMPTEDNTDMGGVEPISAVQSAMADLIAYAFVCDVTRVATFMFKRFVSSTVFNEINAGEQHHSASHQGPNNTAYRNGVTYCMQKFADLLEVFKNTTDIDGTNLLDSTIIYATSDCSTGASHSISRQPIILAGTGRDYLVHPGIHYQATPWNGNHNGPNSAGNMSDVLLACLQRFDPAATSIGAGAPQSTTPLADVIA